MVQGFGYQVMGLDQQHLVIGQARGKPVKVQLQVECMLPGPNGLVVTPCGGVEDEARVLRQSQASGEGRLVRHGARQGIGERVAQLQHLALVAESPPKDLAGIGVLAQQ
ncbi:hypothetical protein D3C76_1138060 [compost metagenome]